MSLVRLVTLSGALALVACGGSNPPGGATAPASPEGKSGGFRAGKAVVYPVAGKPDTYEVVAADERSGVDAEYKFLDTLTCGGGAGTWQMQAQSLQNVGGRYYDVLEVKCTSGDEVKAITFDITSFFGK